MTAVYCEYMRIMRTTKTQKLEFRYTPLREKDKLRLLEIADKYLPDISIWAYGSRVTGNAHESSDLDIVLRSADLKPIPIGAFRILSMLLKNLISRF